MGGGQSYAHRQPYTVPMAIDFSSPEFWLGVLLGIIIVVLLWRRG